MIHVHVVFNWKLVI